MNYAHTRENLRHCFREAVLLLMLLSKLDERNDQLRPLLLPDALWKWYLLRTQRRLPWSYRMFSQEVQQCGHYVGCPLLLAEGRCSFNIPLTEEFLLTFSGTHKIIATWIFFWAFKGVEEWSKNTLHVFSESISIDMALLSRFQREARTCFSYSTKQTCSVFLQDLVKTNSLNLSICKQLLPAHSV